MLDYSIVIPVFNKAALTRRCLETLPPTLKGAGEGEVIVIDNASTDETQAMLAEFPWIQVVRNEENLGFAGANNQGARLARGRYLVLLNNDTQAMDGWLARMLETARDPSVGAVGARLLFPDQTTQHAGVVASGMFFSKMRFAPFHLNYKLAWDDPRVGVVREFQAVTGACLVTPRDVYLKVGGLDEDFWNGYEDVDYCFKVRREGLRVVYNANAVLFHFESQSGAQRFRKTMWNSNLLLERWPDSVTYDAISAHIDQGDLRHANRVMRGGIAWCRLNVPPVSVIVHGADATLDRQAFEKRLRAVRMPIGDVIWVAGVEDIAVAREAMRVRGVRFVAFVDARTVVGEGWLDELVRQVEQTTTAGAATTAENVQVSENSRALAPDGRCCVFQLERYPGRLQLRPFESWNAVIADFALQGLAFGVGTRGVGRPIAQLPPLPDDPGFAARHGFTLDDLGENEARIESLSMMRKRERGLVSIITLSWNAPEFTKIALDSIRRNTSEPYEVIVVDNGSEKETVDMLRAIDDPHIKVIYNETNRGFAGGNNDGLRAASGEFVVLLNNDVFVTEGWIDGLLRPFDHIPALAITAPRSNQVVGHQQVYDSLYKEEEGLIEYARDRAIRLRGRGYVTDRAIGFCLCADRRVIDEIGGLDESFGAGNFEDDDFCIRARAAGYKIYVCDDVFIHHFGSKTFSANNIDYTASMRKNWALFSKKWGYPPAYPTNGYDPGEAIRAGFDRHKHYVPLESAPPREAAESIASSASTVVFWASVDGERAWTDVAPFVRRYLNAFTPDDRVELHLALSGDIDSDVLVRRIERAAEKLGLDAERIPEIVIADEVPAVPHRFNIADILDASPSGLRRLLEGIAS